MARSIFSAAVLLVAVAGLAGCTNSAYFAKPPDPATGMAAVNVPQSDWCQWWYKHEANEFMRKYTKGGQDPEIMHEGEVVKGQILDGRQYGPDGKPLVLNMNGEKEYQIVYRLPVPRTTTINGVPMTTGTPVSSSSVPMNSGLMTTGGLSNVNGMPSSSTSTYPLTGQPSYTPTQPFTPAMPSGVNGGMPGSGYPAGGYGTR